MEIVNSRPGALRPTTVAMMLTLFGKSKMNKRKSYISIRSISSTAENKCSLARERDFVATEHIISHFNETINKNWQVNKTNELRIKYKSEFI